MRAGLYQRYRATTRQTDKGFLGGVIAQAPDADAIVLLIESYAADGRPFNGLIADALRHLALDERPSQMMSGWKEIVGAPLIDLRRRLFAMTGEPGLQASLATASLTAIDRVPHVRPLADAHVATCAT